MTDGVKVTPSHTGGDPVIATDDIGGLHYQEIKTVWGPDGTANITDDAVGKRFPVNIVESALLGAVGETAPVTDIAPSGLNGRQQRLAQHLTSLLARFPALLTALGALKTGPTEGTATVSVAGGNNVSAAVDTTGMRNMGIRVPSTFDGSQITFQNGDTLAGTYQDIYDITGAQVIMTVAASRDYDLPGELMWVRFLKIVCGTAQATTNTDFTLFYRS